MSAPNGKPNDKINDNGKPCETKKDGSDTYASEGMVWGMVFGMLAGTAYSVIFDAWGVATGIGLCLGMIFGMGIGMSIKKKPADDPPCDGTDGDE